MATSVTIMAHKKRRKFVEKLKPQLADAGAVWDRNNDRWDTGRRALLSFDPAADWHLVVQDDAVLCDHFLEGVEAALKEVPLEVPVSFYTGKVRPHANQVREAVEATKLAGKSFFEMRGPLWGVAIAIPVKIIEQMVEECDDTDIPNYDMRMAEYFHGKGIPCWYSVPSLVDHRVGDENPSLVPGRGSGLARVAHEFCRVDPRNIDWAQGAYQPGDPSEWWTEEGVCTRCWHKNEDIPAAIEHAYRKHGLGQVDFLASTLYHARDLRDLYDAIPKAVRGKFFIVDSDVSIRVDFDHERMNRRSAKNKIGKAGPFTIVGAARDFRWIGNRPGWSLTGAESN